MHTVSIHAPAQGATLQDLAYLFVHRDVSIHAPAQGATPLLPGRNRSLRVSIHAPAQGATRMKRGKK